MNFTFSDEQIALRETIAGFLATRSSSERVRDAMETDLGYDRDVWDQMAAQMALPGLHVPEEYGGQGFSIVEVGIVFEEMGRHLLCAPFYASVALAANALLTVGGDEERKQLLPGIADGSTTATLAYSSTSATWRPRDIGVTWQYADGGYVLDGEAKFVVDGASADLVLVAARHQDASEDDVTLFAVERGADGVQRNPREPMDQTRKLADLRFSGASAGLVGREGQATEGLTRAFDLAAVLLSAEMAGGAEQTLNMAVEYAKTREQFGRPIGSFQAIKHKCADMLLEVESAKSAVYHALWSASTDDPEFPIVASVAKAYTSDAYFHCAAENIQIHGGIGFTWEHDAHLYFKRAAWSRDHLGDAHHHRDLLLTRISG